MRGCAAPPICYNGEKRVLCLSTKIHAAGDPRFKEDTMLLSEIRSYWDRRAEGYSLTIHQQLAGEVGAFFRRVLKDCAPAGTICAVSMWLRPRLLLHLRRRRATTSPPWTIPKGC